MTSISQIPLKGAGEGGSVVGGGIGGKESTVSTVGGKTGGKKGAVVGLGVGGTIGGRVGRNVGPGEGGKIGGSVGPGVGPGVGGKVGGKVGPGAGAKVGGRVGPGVGGRVGGGTGGSGEEEIHNHRLTEWCKCLSGVPFPIYNTTMYVPVSGVTGLCVGGKVGGGRTMKSIFCMS